MNYERTYWEDSPSSTTPLDAEKLNKIESALVEASESINNLENEVKKKVNEDDVYLDEEADSHFLSADKPGGSVETENIVNTENKIPNKYFFFITYLIFNIYILTFFYFLL